MRTSFLGHVCSIAFLWKCALSTIKQEAKKSSLSLWRCLRNGCSHMTKFSSVIRLVGMQVTGISFLQSSNTNNKNNGYFETLVPNVVMTLLQWFHCVYTFCDDVCISRMKNKSMMSFFSCHMKTSFGCSKVHIFTLSKLLWWRCQTLIYNLLS